MRRVLLTLIAIVVLTLCGCSSTDGRVSPFAQEPCAADVAPDAPKVVAGGETQPADVMAPEVITQVNPIADRSLVGKSVTATVEAIIGEDGKPRNICVTAGDHTWGRAVADALRKWTFKPATLRGQPVAVRFELTSRLRG